VLGSAPGSGEPARAMNILVLNCGSSSVKAAVIDPETGERLAKVVIERIGPNGHASALADALPDLLESAGGAAKVSAVGHRIVHGGDRFREPTRIDDAVETAIEALSPLAPLHNPANLSGVRAARKLLPNIEHVAVFDTAFHATLPNRAKHYAIDYELAAKHEVRRYGFHGTSHAYVSARAATFLGASLRDLRIVSCHLGNGASVCAVEYGRSVETSMGMTPLEGLVMGTRAGDIDAGAVLHIARAEGLDLDGIDQLLNKKSGLAGLAGVGNDMRDIEARAADGDERCRLAIHVFAHRLRKYIGAYAAVMGGVDAVVFTGGIGHNSAVVRHHATRNLQFLGADIDEEKNRTARACVETPVVRFSSDRSRTQLLAVLTDEEHAIARDTARIAAGKDRVELTKVIPIAVSARHIHLTTASVDALFGVGHKLTPRSPLSQPDQFACEETLDVVGPKRTIKGVRVLGPTRPADQVEVSRTDEFFLGLDAPIRDSGDVRGSPGVTLVGPKGQITIAEGIICARRHIHMHPDDASHFGVKDRDVVEIAIDSRGRDLTLGDVLVRVSPKFRLEMHIDTDEANAAELEPAAKGMLELTGGVATLLKRSVRDVVR